jgi:hypothetical protein
MQHFFIQYTQKTLYQGRAFLLLNTGEFITDTFINFNLSLVYFAFLKYLKNSEFGSVTMIFDEFSNDFL